VWQSIGLVIGGEAEPLATENGKDKVHVRASLFFLIALEPSIE